MWSSGITVGVGSLLPVCGSQGLYSSPQTVPLSTQHLASPESMYFDIFAIKIQIIRKGTNNQRVVIRSQELNISSSQEPTAKNSPPFATRVCELDFVCLRMFVPVCREARG